MLRQLTEPGTENAETRSIVVLGAYRHGMTNPKDLLSSMRTLYLGVSK